MMLYDDMRHDGVEGARILSDETVRARRDQEITDWGSEASMDKREREATEHNIRKRKADDALARASSWLADANEAREAGNAVKAAKCDAKSQFWLDRYNRLTGRA